MTISRPKTMTLDVGSGHLTTHVAKGEINIDIEKPVSIPRNFIRADAHHLPFRKKMFDQVFLYEVIEHVENPSECLREIHQVLKNGGRVVISTPNPLHYRKFLMVARLKRIKLGGKDHISTWTHAEMENLLEKTGFTNSIIFYKNLKHYLHLPHTLLDKVIFKLLPSPISGRNMIAIAKKKQNRK